MGTQPPDPVDRFVRRVARTAWGLVAVGAAGELILRQSPIGAACLTGAGAVAIINFRWLGVVLQRVAQPGKPQYDRRSILRIVGRLVLFAGFFAALLVVPRVDPVAVALGISTLVVALVVQGFRRGRVGGG
jgi:hypothetical protein